MKSITTLAFAIILFASAGCATTDSGNPSKSKYQAPTDLLQVGDLVTVSFSGIGNPPPPHNERIKEDGTLTLPLLGPVKAVGKTAGQLQKELEKLYVPQYFNQLTVTVVPDSRYFFVFGQVTKPERYAYAGNLTLLKAIAAAGDFTDFANRKKVEVTRSNGERLVINCYKAQDNPALDVQIFPGDKIYVPRRYF